MLKGRVFPCAVTGRMMPESYLLRFSKGKD